MRANMLNSKGFKQFHGKSFDELETAVRAAYPFATGPDFDGGGQVYFYSGLWLGNEPIKILTNLYEWEQSDHNGDYTGSLLRWKSSPL